MSKLINRPFHVVALIVAGLIVLGGTGTSLALTPNPPITGRYSVKAFIGGTKKVILSIYPPQTFTDDMPIPAGTKMEVKVYRSYDRGKTYGKKGVEVVKQRFVPFKNPETGQNRFDPARMSWIEVVCLTPVDPPRSDTAIDLLGVRADGSKAPEENTIVYLAASVVVDGVESARTNRYLTFRYAIGGIPGLVRYETPDTKGPVVPTQLARVPAAVLADRGGVWKGEYMITALTIPKAIRESSMMREEGCQKAIAQVEAAKGKKTPMKIKVTSITNNALANPRGVTFHPGTVDVIMDQINGKGDPQTFKADLVYFRNRSYVAIVDIVKEGSLEMIGDVLENATEYEIDGPFRFKVFKDGKELAIIHGMWMVRRRK